MTNRTVRCRPLRTDPAFRAVLSRRGGEYRKADQYFAFQFGPGDDPSVVRLGLRVGKRHLPRAVDRNKLKRLVRQAVRNQSPGLTGMDLVFHSRPAIAKADWAQLGQKLETALTSLGPKK